MSERKKYLHCFNCSQEIFEKGEDFSRISYINKNGKKRTKPVCFGCQADWGATDYECYLDEQEAKEYAESLKRYEEARKKWREKDDFYRKRKKEEGIGIPHEHYLNAPSEPLDREEREIANYYIHKYGEY